MLDGNQECTKCLGDQLMQVAMHIQITGHHNDKIDNQYQLAYSEQNQPQDV